MTRDINAPRLDLWIQQTPEDEAAERERAAGMPCEDRADELYQAWKEGDL